MNSTNYKKIDSSKFILFSVVLVTVLVIVVLCLSFAVFKETETSHNSADDLYADISMTYTENTNGISIQDALPISDQVGKALSGKGEYFDFTVRSKVPGKASVTYEIAAIKDKKSTVADSDVKLYLEKQVNGTYEAVSEPIVFTPINSGTKIGSPKGSMILRKVNKKESGFDNYRLRMWIREGATVDPDKIYTIKINVYGKAF